jgi:two-component system, NtrC family, sensor kinase
MPAAPFPANEIERVSALHRSGLLESGPDVDLEEIVRQAAALWGTPIAAVSLLDETHQHFKASVGVGVPHTSRDMAFCGYVILQSEPLVVLDAHVDPRFADNPLVLGRPDIRFYVGVPVYGQDRQPFGALCVIDTTERIAVDDASIQSFLVLSDRVSKILSAPNRSWP